MITPYLGSEFKWHYNTTWQNSNGRTYKPLFIKSNLSQQKSGLRMFSDFRVLRIQLYFWVQVRAPNPNGKIVFLLQQGKHSGPLICHLCLGVTLPLHSSPHQWNIHIITHGTFHLFPFPRHLWWNGTLIYWLDK